MSHISDQNIEHWFFRYSEGDLSDQEKDYFMNYILNHPEYNDEFVYWSNIKISPELEICDLELEKSLIKPESNNHIGKYKYIGIGLICFSLIFSYLFIKNNDLKNNKKTLISNNKNNHAKKDSLPHNILNPDKTIEKPIEKKVVTKAKVVNQTQTDTTKKIIENVIDNENITTHEITSKIDTNLISNSPNLNVANKIDSLEVNDSSIMSNKKEQQRKRKKKSRNSFSIKPNQDFKIDNPDF